MDFFLIRSKKPKKKIIRRVRKYIIPKSFMALSNEFGKKMLKKITQ